MSEVAVVRDVAAAAAELFVESVSGAVAARGRACVALTGGSSATPLFALLRAQRTLPWDRVHFFFTDERAVSPSDPLSNFGLADRELLARVPVAPAQVHRIRAEEPDREAEGRRYANEIRQTTGNPPRFDLVLLGLGPDGHICSLFAGVPTSGERGDDRLVRAVASPEHVEPHVPRITLTPFLVVTARNVALQVSGAAKAPVLARALRDPEDLVACPAQWLRRASGRVVVACDEAAAANL